MARQDVLLTTHVVSQVRNTAGKGYKKYFVEFFQAIDQSMVDGSREGMKLTEMGI